MIQEENRNLPPLQTAKGWGTPVKSTAVQKQMPESSHEREDDVHLRGWGFGAVGHPPKQVIQALEGNFASFANYSSPDGKSYTVFTPGSLSQGETLRIDRTLNLPLFPRSWTSGTDQVNVTGLTQTGFTFQAVAGEHPLNPGQVSFSASDAGSGQINFTISLQGNFAHSWDWLGYKMGGGSYENNVWANLVNNIKALCNKKK
jgi:hypothetical protein